MGSFPLGTLAGTFHKSLFNFDAGDMNQAYDPARATRGAETANFGDLKDMASGLFGDIMAAVQQHVGGRPGPQADPSPAEPGTVDDARRLHRPQVSEDARQQAQSQSGLGGWGKALLYGGLALGGLSLLSDFTMGGAFGMPFYGGMAPWMMNPVMNPMMTPGVFW